MIGRNIESIEKWVSASKKGQMEIAEAIDFLESIRGNDHHAGSAWFDFILHVESDLEVVLAREAGR